MGITDKNDNPRKTHQHVHYCPVDSHDKSIDCCDHAKDASPTHDHLSINLTPLMRLSPNGTLTTTNGPLSLHNIPPLVSSNVSEIAIHMNSSPHPQQDLPQSAISTISIPPSALHLSPMLQHNEHMDDDSTVPSAIVSPHISVRLQRVLRALSSPCATTLTDSSAVPIPPNDGSSPVLCTPTTRHLLSLETAVPSSTLPTTVIVEYMGTDKGYIYYRDYLVYVRGHTEDLHDAETLESLLRKCKDVEIWAYPETVWNLGSSKLYPSCVHIKGMPIH